MDPNNNLTKEERFEKTVNHLRKQFEEMPEIVLLMVQGVLIDVMQEKMGKDEGVNLHVE